MESYLITITKREVLRASAEHARAIYSARQSDDPDDPKRQEEIANLLAKYRILKAKRAIQIALADMQDLDAETRLMLAREILGSEADV